MNTLEEQIHKILSKHITIDGDEIKVYKNAAAKEITAHVFEFVEWLKNNCLTNLKDFKDGMQWAIFKDISDWDGEPKKWYTSEEIYSYWLDNVYSK